MDPLIWLLQGRGADRRKWRKEVATEIATFLCQVTEDMSYIQTLR